MTRAKLFFTGASALLAFAAASPTAEAGGRARHDNPIAVSSVVNRTRAAHTEAELRDDFADALDTASFDGVPNGRRYLLAASLIELDRTASRSSSVTTSTFEVAVVDGSTSKIVGVVRGRARVESSPADGGADDAALRAAAKRAVESAVLVARST